MAVSNQNIVRIDSRKPFDKSNTYSMMHIDGLQKAMCELKGETLKLWLYCEKNQDGYQFELSQKALQDWGLKKDAYQTAKKKLIELGYLEPISEDSNILVFYEYSRKDREAKQSEKPTKCQSSENQTQSEIQTILSEKPIPVGSEKQIESEKPTISKNEESEKPITAIGKMSEKPTALSGFQTSQSEKAQRNNTIVHNSTMDDNTFPTISRGIIEQLFMNPEYLGEGLVKNGDKIFRIVEEE